MKVDIFKVNPSERELTRFVKFGIDHYKGNSCFVPPLVSDEVETLSPLKNPAFDYCSAQAFMAVDCCTKKTVGRIVAIINNIVNSRTGKREARFGFVDFIDDPDVSAALFAAAEQWAREHGMTEMIGPMGFTDMDHEGLLIDGFNEMGTMATIYNYPYYPVHIANLGYSPDADWVEYRVKVPDRTPEKFRRIAKIVAQKYGLRSLHFKSRKKLKERYGQELFELINEAYDKLYGYSPLSQRQIEYYIGKYLGMIRLDCLSVIVDSNDRLVAAGITMPSLSHALRRSRGRLFPFGWFHLLKAIYAHNPVVDLLLIAVRNEYKSRGINALIFADLVPAFINRRFIVAESNLELEGNESVRLQWQYFDHRLHRRRRVYRKTL